MKFQQFLIRNIWGIFISGVFGLMALGFYLYIPIASKNIIDIGIASHDKSRLALFIFLFAINSVIAELSFSLKQIFVTYIESLFSLFLRENMFKKIRNIINLDKFSSGQLISFNTNDVHLVKQKFRIHFENFLSMVQLIIIIILVSLINIHFLIIVLIIIPIYSFLPKFLGAKITKQSSIIQKNLEDITIGLANSYSISKEIRIFQMENWDIIRTSKLFKRNIKPVIKLEVLNNLFVIGEILYTILLCVIFYIGAIMVQDNRISIGTLFALTTYIGNISKPVHGIIFNYGYLKNVKASEKRIEKLLLAEERKEFDGFVIKEPISNLCFSNVSLKRGSNKLLNNLSFTINTPSFIGIIGKSGSGKTTILNLISKLISPTSGKIYLNSTDINNISDKEYYNYIKYVFQENNFIKGSLSDNLFIEQNSIKQKQANYLLSVLDMEFFCDNFDYEIDSEGKNLSGGQKQRLSIIRALLFNPPILLLDEVTSALDKLLSIKIINVIKEFRRDKITILITHDNDLTKMLDNIIEIEDGQIKSYGHESILLTQNNYDLSLSTKE